MSSALDAKLGDIIRCTVRLVTKKNDTEYHWLIARVLEPRPEKTEPDPPSVPESIWKATGKKMVEQYNLIVEIAGEEYIDVEEWKRIFGEEPLEGFEICL